MDLDIDDLESSWTFDQVFDQTPSFVLSGSDQPWSPLWSFPEDKLAGIGNSMFAAGNPDLATQSPFGDDVKRSLSPPLLGLRPLDHADSSCLIKERMTQALRYLKESSELHVLAQLWAPVKSGDRYVLTTSGQPFVLDPNTNGLHQYRMVSLKYMFSVDGESGGGLGLPGRVFQQKLPEWTPNVQYYSSKEYPRLNHAQHCNVRGTLALPIFEPFGHSCLGVLELIMTSQKINYAPEVDKVCKALEAVNLKSSEVLDHPNTQFCNEGRQNALAEIMEIFTLVCETHKLPLAQTWVPCMHRSVLANGGGLKKSCSSFDGSCMGQVCMSTTDVAFYIINPTMWGFRQACAEHHLLKGQGVAGRAFSSQSSCFCEDITQFCKSEYPLVHYARMFGLSSSFAICLHSTHTGNDDYVLEFFMPPNMFDSMDQQTWLDSLLVTMKQRFRSLKVASGKELDDPGFVEIIKSSVDKKLASGLESVIITQSTISSPGPDALQNGGEMVDLDSLEQQIMVGVDPVNGSQSVDDISGVQNGVSCSEKDIRKKSEKKRGKPEKSISLEVLQQYFTGSLKDAAKSLGVCPTTMKRICRQHGISRWPSRKINKVNRGLSKLKRIMESVQGTEGTFTSLTAPIGSVSWPAKLNESNQHGSNPLEPPEEKNSIATHPITGSEKQTETVNQMNGGRVLDYNDFFNVQMGFLTELGEGSNQSKTESGSREEGSGTPTSRASCQVSPSLGFESSSSPDDQVLAPKEEGLFELASEQIQELNQSSVFSIPKVALTAQRQEPFKGLLIEDAGSSHNLTNLCSLGETFFDEQTLEYSHTNPPCSNGVLEEPKATPGVRMPKFSSRTEFETITIKATYREDIIRFRLSLNSGIVNLKEEVAIRLKLEMGAFDIRYLDDDHEWVLLACDADLEECMDISRLSGINTIRLLVNDI
ncbi:hypothetical protein LguiB_028983 [Lonicera macranthoides]